MDKNWLMEIPSCKSHQGTKNSSWLCFLLHTCHCNILRLLGTVNPPPTFNSAIQSIIIILYFQLKNISRSKLRKGFLVFIYLNKETSDQCPMQEEKMNQHESRGHFHMGQPGKLLDQTRHFCKYLSHEEVLISMFA